MSPQSQATYSRHPARGALARLAADLWLQEAPAEVAEAAPTVLAPVASVDLLFTFADRFERLEETGALELPAMHVVGPRTRAMKVRATGRTGLVIARLHPWAARRLIGDAPEPLVDGHVDIADVVPASTVAEIMDRIAEAASSDARIATAAAWLEDRLGDEPPDPLVVAAARRISATVGSVTVADLAAGLGISERQLRRRFHAAAGLGPKRFARIVRFQAAVGMLRAGRSWGDVVERCGFFDQAHLIGELRAMADATPPGLQRGATTPLGAYFNSGDSSTPYGTTYL
ncbi:MAG: helix-turn-helix domain-containing protein [Acidobacteriota bacterium]|jgi:AraC-like DNA-binding protein